MAELETERECRICRGEDEQGRPLLHPCRCSGSIKYTHEDCLVNWLSQSGSSRCELCNHSFRFEPLYQPNTPSALPTREFIIGVLALTSKTLRTAARIVLVFTVWLFFLPVGTCWTWYALFINSPAQLPGLLASRGPAGVFVDAFYGCLLSAGIVFVFLGVTSLREYVRHFPQDELGEEEHAFDLFGNDDELDLDDFDDFSSDDGDNHPHPLLNHPMPDLAQGFPLDMVVNRNPFRDIVIPYDDDELDAPHPPVFPNAANGDQILDNNDEVFDEMDELVRDTYDVIAGGDDSDDAARDEADLLAEDSEDEEEPLAFDGLGDNHALPPLMDDAIDASGSENFDDDVAPQHDNQIIGDDFNRNNLIRNDRPDDGDLDDNEGGGDGGALFGLFELDPDDVPLEEVVGLRGHIRNLFDNAGTVLVSNAIFLGVFTLIPLLIGRLTLRLFHLQNFPSRIYFVYNEAATRSSFKNIWPTLVEEGPASISTAGRNFSETVQHHSSAALKTSGEHFGKAARLVGPQAALRHPAVASAVGSPGSIGSTDPILVSYDNFLVVLLGYGMIALVAVGYIGVISMLRQRYPRLDSPITRQVARLLRYIATFVKIVVLILFEFGVFPLGCGWWLDICTLEILGGGLQSRLAFCRDSPWTCTGGHWVMGIIYMVHISLFISLLREIVRPQLLWFLRNPDDPEFHPFRELVEKPLSRHARRMCISVIIYVPLILALVYAPAQLCLKLLPRVFPFRSEDFSHILIDVPFGNLLIGPLIRLVYFGRPGISLQTVVATWIRWVSDALGIAHLVVKDEDGEDNDEIAGPNPDVDGNRNIEGLQVGNPGPLQRIFGDHDEDMVNGIPIRDEATDVDASEDSDAGHDLGYGQLTRREVRIRAVVMIVSAWITLILAESALIAIPTVLGRSLMGWLGLPVRHDLHPFLLGLNAVLGTLSLIARLVQYFESVDTLAALFLGLPYLYRLGKGLLIIFTWLVVIPLASGLLFELILLPVRVAHNETPFFCLHQDWAIGLLLLKVWTCIAVTGGLGSKWRERVLRAREGDIIGQNQNFSRTMREVVLPVLLSLVTALSVPYSFARGVLPFLGTSRWISNLAYRYAYLIITCTCCGYETVRYSVSILRGLHDSIRDEKYLMGKRLYNFMEASEVEARNE